MPPNLFLIKMNNNTQNSSETYSNWLTNKNDKSKSTLWVIGISYLIAFGSLVLSLSSLLGYKPLAPQFLKLIELIATLIIISITLLLMARNPLFENSIASMVVSQMAARNLVTEADKITDFTYIETCYDEFSKRWKNFLEWLLYFYILMFANWIFQYGGSPLVKNNILIINTPYFQIISNDCLLKILSCFIFNIRSFNLWLCYKVLHDLKSPIVDYSKPYKEVHNKFYHHKLLMRIVVSLFAVAQYLCYYHFRTPEATEKITLFFLILSGIWGSYTLGMLATHFESRLINVQPAPVALILIYAAIHPLLFTILEKEGVLMEIGIFILFLALTLKTHLFLFTHYLYEKRKLMKYFIMMPLFSKNVKDLLD